MSSSTNAIHFHCESCKYELAVPIELAGITGPCPQCGATIKSPTLEEYERKEAAASIHAQDASVKAAIPPIRPNAVVPEAVDLTTPVLDLTPKPAEVDLSTKDQSPVEEEGIPKKLITEDVARSSPQWDDVGLARSLSRPPGRSLPQGRSKKWTSLVIALISLLVVVTCMIIFYYQPLREKVIVYMERQRVEDKEYTLTQLESSTGSEAGNQNQDEKSPEVLKRKLEPTPPPLLELRKEESTHSEPAPELPVKDAPNPTTPEPLPVPEAGKPTDAGEPKKPEAAELSVKRARPVDETSLPETQIVIEATPAVKDALEAIKSFCAAKTWEDRANYVQYEEEVKPMMKQFYEANAYRQVNLAYIELLHHEAKPTDGTAPHAVFNISGGGLEKPVPVMAEQHQDGWKIDWLAFTEFSEDLLERFMSDYVESTTRFRVMIRRKTFFGDGRLKAKDSFEIKPAVAGFEAYVFTEKGSPISEILNREVPWNRQPLAVIAELKWRQEGGLKWVEIVSLPQLNWKNRGPEVTKAEAVE